MTKVELTDEEKEKLRKAKNKKLVEYEFPLMPLRLAKEEEIEVPLKGLRIAKKDEEKEKGED